MYIKREDAIEAIDKMICDNKWVCECAINSFPSAEPQGELISKKDVVKAVTNYIWHLPNECYKNFNSYNDIEEVVTDAVKQLPSTNDNWIPVSERLPENKEETYWVCTDTEYQCECRWTNISPIFTYMTTDWHWNWFDIPQYTKVTAWQPLPTPYREENEE